MSELDELKKWLNELDYHYKTIQNLGMLTSDERNYKDAYDTVRKKIAEIEEKNNQTTPTKS